jgi:AraC family transcriptional regulator
MPATMAQGNPAVRVEPITFGSPRFRSIETGGLLVTDAIFPPRERLCAHVHERTCVATTLDGTFDSGMRGRSHWSRASMLLTEPAGERHENVFGPAGAHVLVVQPDSRRVELVRPFTRLLDAINQLTDPRVGLLARRISLEIARPDDLTPLAVEALGLELFAVAARQFTAARLRPGAGDQARFAPAWLARVRERLHDDFADAPTLDALARIAGVHPGHLTRVFRRHYGRSIGAYLRDLRLEWTARRLATSDDPLIAIAAAAGFADQSHLTRAFKARFGCTPGRYRSRKPYRPV